MTWEVSRLAVDGRLVLVVRALVVFAGCVVVSLSTSRSMMAISSIPSIPSISSASAEPLLPGRRLFNVELDNASSLVFDWRTGIAIPIYLIMSMLAVASGVGGGLFWVPLFTALLQFSVKSAAALSQSCVAGGCIGGTLYSIMQRHPHDRLRPVMDYNLSLVLMPALVQGISFGVMLNYILPSLVLSCLLVITLLLISARTLHQGIKMVQAEQRVKRMAREARALEAASQESQDADRLSLSLSPPVLTAYTDDETVTLDGESMGSRQSPAAVLDEGGSGNGKDAKGGARPGAGNEVNPDVLAAKLSLAEQGASDDPGESTPSRMYRASMTLIKQTSLTVHRHTTKRVVRVLGKIQKPVIPWLPFLSNWGIFLVFLGLQVGKSFFSNCSWETWTMFAVQIVFMVCSSVYFIWFQEHPEPIKHSHHGLEGGSGSDVEDVCSSIASDGSDNEGSASEGGDNDGSDSGGQEWKPSRLALIWTMTLLLGCLAGMVGLGGGVMMSPLLLELRVHPQAAAATSTFITVFASTTAAVTFGLQDRLNLEYMALFAPICLIGGFLGVYVLTGLIKKYKCTSVVNVLVGSLILLSAVLVGAFSLRDEAVAVADGGY